MRYVLLGSVSAEWATRQKDRTGVVKAKLKELGITLESVNYTQGPYDFVDVVVAPNPEVILVLSVWYAKQGYGRIASLPAFDEATMEAAVKRAT